MMKKLQLKKIGKFLPFSNGILRKVLSVILFFLLVTGFQVSAQLPVVTVRFHNPQFDCETQIYCVDVEFQSAVANQQLYGINVRFYYDDLVLEYLGFGDFAPGYGANVPVITTGIASSGQTLFGFPANHPAEYLNGAVQLIAPSPILLATAPNWTKLFKVCFQIDDPNAFDQEAFCPSIVWDLEEDPANGGFSPASNGVVISLADPPLAPPGSSTPTTENVVQFNWAYDGVVGVPFGNPTPTDCISTICAFLDFGDAPEGAMAYPESFIMGKFPTCLDPTLAGYIQHNVSEIPKVFFGPMVDPEIDGNGGICSPYATYNNDECFADGDAGLIKPDAPSTINGLGKYVSCTGIPSKLCVTGDTIMWGPDLDIFVTNLSEQQVYVNLLVDWNRNGMWDYDPTTIVLGNVIPEHCLVNFVVGPGFTGPLSSLAPPPVYSGPLSGYVWARFSVTETPVEENWDGSGEFALGETEDYLFLVDPRKEIPLSDWALALGFLMIAAFTIIRLRKI